MHRRGAGRFNLTVTAPADIDGLSFEALKALVVQLLSQAAEQERLIAELREENARLKGLNGRPRIKPSGMEDASERKLPGKRGKRRRRGKIVPRVGIEDRVIQAQVPPGSRFKGYETFVVQDIVLRAEAIRYRRERWITPDGTMVVAPLPAGVVGHFGPELRRFVLAQHHQGQVTVPRLAAQLRGIGVAISKRQVMRLLIAGQDGFLAENRDVLRAGLQTAAWVSVDDIGAHHAGKNGFCTHIWTAPSLQGVLQCFDQIACVHMSGLFVRSHMNAGQDGFRDKSSKQKGDLMKGHWKIRNVSRRGSIDHTICSLSCKFWPSAPHGCS